jgi:hypothetical protein
LNFDLISILGNRKNQKSKNQKSKNPCFATFFTAVRDLT